MAQESHLQALAHYDRGCALQARQDLEAAISCYDQALALNPSLAQAYSNRGAAFAALNRCGEALASLDRAISLVPAYPEAHFCRAVTLLLKGELPKGWIEFEWRWKTGPGQALRRSKSFAQPPWLGQEAVAGKTLLIHCERGLGDTLQFCRYAPMVVQLGAKVILQVQEPLVALLRRSFADVQVIGEADALPHFDMQCPLLSLPLVFDTALNTIPAMRRYLRANADRVSQLRSQLARQGRVERIGLVWRGDADNPDDVNRSLALSDLLPFLPPDLLYFSLQKEVTADERACIEANPRFSAMSGAMNFEDTAALCECLDLVVAIDTSVAHLAAALGVPAWILLPFNPDCRWLLERTDSPWYPSAKLYRQTSRGDWSQVLERIRADLGRLPPRARGD